MKMYCTSTINVRNDDRISQKTNADVWNDVVHMSYLAL